MLWDKKVYDITRIIQNDMTVWPGDDRVFIERTLSISEGGLANISKINMGVHTGTHMDAPSHFIDGGETIEAISLDKLYGEVLIIESKEEMIEKSHLQGHDLGAVNAVFFKTACSARDEMAPFLDRYPAVTEQCARQLIDKGIKTVGTDYYSIEYCTDNRFPVHKLLLSHGVSIVENLCLKDIKAGRYSFVCLPMKIRGSDGAPCRVLLFQPI